MAAVNAPARPVALSTGVVTIRYDINALIEIEERYGNLAGIDAAIDKMPVKATRFLLWVGMGQPGTEKDAGDLLTGTPLAPVMKAIADALVESFGSQAAADEAGPTKPEMAGVNGVTS